MGTASHVRGAAGLAAAALAAALALPTAGPAHAEPAPVPTADGLSPIPGQSPPADPVHRLAGGCYSLQVAGGPRSGDAVQRSGPGYAVGPGHPEAFRTEAAQLGRFLFFGRDGRLLTETAASDLPVAGALRTQEGTAPGPVTALGEATPGADWRVDYADGSYGLTATVSGRGLTVDDSTGAVVADAPGAPGTRFRLIAADGCADFPDAQVNATGMPHSGTDANGNVVGRIDAHAHMATDGFLGGAAHCGRPVSPLGITVALDDCPDHKPDGVPALLENIVSHGTPVATHDTTGWPTFAGYPEAHSLTHEQTYHRWVERAWRSGLRMMSDLVVTNDVLCRVYWLGDTPCDPMTVARMQMRELHGIEDYIDARHGGPGRGWFRVVADPAQARRVVESGRLAVVPGIEMSDLADCSLSDGTPDCTKQDIDRTLDDLHAMGVRQVILVHKFDNALGGTRMDSGFNGLAVNVGNSLATGRFWQASACTGDEADSPQPVDAPQAPRLESALPPGVTLPVYPPAPVCNNRGLTELGRYAVHGLMRRGMIVDIDHMDVATADATLDILERAGYPHVVSSHSWTDPHTYPRILRLGGFVSLMAKGKETEPFTDRWRALREQVPPGRFFGVGRSSDVNGFAPQVGPPTEGPAVRYPFTASDGTVLGRERTGSRVFDFTADGVAQYGLYPDWVEYLRLRAGTDAPRLTADLDRGAEAYLRMWEGR